MSVTDTTAPPSHQVALSFEDGVTRFITCRPDQTVADASYRQRINIPLDCRDGACGTCKAFCESGEYDGGTYIEDALSDDEAAQGYALPCSMRPRSDLVLQIASTSEVAKTKAATYTGSVTALDRLSPTTIELKVQIPNRDELAFLPGQYVNIDVPGADAKRSYSFSNAPDAEELSFLVKLTPGGVMSDYLTERAAVGDELSFTGPHGSFFLRETDRPVLLLAGGTGLAPILSMLRKLRGEDSGRLAHLVYGVSTDDDLVSLEELAELERALPGFTWDHCVSDRNSAAEHKGYVTDLIGPEHLHEGDVALYLCGPPAMVESVRKGVAEVGVEPTGFYYEKFALAAAAGSQEAPSVEATATVATEIPLEELLLASDARGIVGREIWPEREVQMLTGPAALVDDAGAIRGVGGQQLHPTGDASAPAVELDESADLITGLATRTIGGQELFAAAAIEVGAPETEAAEPVPATEPASETAPDGYQIGEEHPDINSSDAIFEAREALELGALELVIGRLSSGQLTGYRLLAESTLPYVDGDRFVDAAAYTDTNAAFHDYLFALTGNEHLLRAYQALGVKGRMSEVLVNATWCNPRCATDHIEIVDAFEAGDRTTAQRLIIEHASRSKETMRRAMRDAVAATRPRYITPGRFADQVVIVTGAAQGIGAQVARRVSAEGGRVVVADRSELVHEIATELRDGAGCLPVQCDLESYSGATELVQQSIAEFGRVDVLINNVGGAINFKPFTEFSDTEIEAEIQRSLMTTLFACRAALPGMVQQGAGVIVNVSSAATRGIHRIPYSAAKGGINAITQSLAMEYAGHGIRVVATAPGGTDAPPRRISRGTPEARTEQEKEWFQAHIDQTLASAPMHRYGTLDEQAAAITFLASGEASYITGAVLPVAGGDLG
ncbi:benzoate 1,2-dioxygenase electron transfer component BenC [Flexivirga oryzae]|uniref:Benzoate/toluate 1,2-dioxygenase reductase subunit n=1 Tax=Flexivirga oryzae TaxID=1794944 RepID=A0A839N7I2_9MICO|nr:benzoate 1,2-dioxygenase electron transfer component BenC [Flexivirga oryzae]MBB2891974.1 benzoate/toluate 1,2-dioxygenase reductase subunit [Flexivirga oryzae]